MASDVVSEAVKAHLTTNWTTTPIQWENEPAVETVDAQGMTIPWILVEYTGDIYDQESIGAPTQAANLWNEEGKIFIHVFVKAGSGGSLARKYAKQLADLFRGRQLLSDQSLDFFGASIGMGEIGDELGKWFRISVVINYRQWNA